MRSEEASTLACCLQKGTSLHSWSSACPRSPISLEEAFREEVQRDRRKQLHSQAQRGAHDWKPESLVTKKQLTKTASWALLQMIAYQAFFFFFPGLNRHMLQTSEKPFETWGSFNWWIIKNPPAVTSYKEEAMEHDPHIVLCPETPHNAHHRSHLTYQDLNPSTGHRLRARIHSILTT